MKMKKTYKLILQTLVLLIHRTWIYDSEKGRKQTSTKNHFHHNEENVENARNAKQLFATVIVSSAIGISL